MKMEVTMNKLLVLVLVIGLSLTLSSTTIYDVQYTTVAGDGTYPSPMVGQEVTIEGVVTGADFIGYADNFFMSMPEGGPWKGIYVYYSGYEASIGEVVEVTGEVTEYNGFTEISWVSDISVIGEDDVPAPTVVNTGDLIDAEDAEQYESCLIQIQNVTVTEEQIDYGQWYVDDGSGECQMDDGFFYLDDVEPPIVITVDDTWARLTGILDYSFDEYGINPRTPDDMVHDLSTDNKDIDNLIILGNYPNPFTTGTTISFNIKEAGQTKLEIYNATGQKVRTLINGNKDAANYNIPWNGKNDEGRYVAAGVYLYKLRHGGRYTSTKKMILMK